MKFFTALLLFSSLAVAGIDPLVLIRGTATGSFTENEIQVKDSFGQVYSLPKSAFPKDFKPEAGKSFTIEVHEKILKDVKIQKPKTKK